MASPQGQYDLAKHFRHAEAPKPSIIRAGTVFPFFDLPLELRKAVYLLCRKKQTLPVKPGNKRFWELSVSPCVRINLLLVSKQFKIEYEDEIFRTATLYGQAMISPSFPLELPFTIPEYLSTRVRRVEYTVNVLDWPRAKCVLDEPEQLLSLVCPCCNPEVINTTFEVRADRWRLDPLCNPSASPHDHPCGLLCRIARLFREVEAIRECCEAIDGSLHFQGGVIIRDNLYDILETATDGMYDGDDWSDEIDEKLNEEVQGAAENFIDYRIVYSPGESHHLGFEAIECGYFDAAKYDRIVEMVEDDDTEDSDAYSVE